MRRIVLKIDVDTDRGTMEGVPRLAHLLEKLDARATFLFSLGPDQTGRALRRVFRRGFLGKVRRTSVLKHYGVKTLLYGTLLPGPHIGRRRGALMRDVAGSGFEVGVHTYNHAKWQDGVAAASERWTRQQLVLARDQFTEIFSRPPLVHGAAGWQVNEHVPELERQLGFRYASDARGTGPFIPMINGVPVGVPQLPTTLPTLDELIGRDDLVEADPIAHLLALTGNLVESDHVYTLHAELEGGRYLGAFERLIRAWRKRGLQLTDLASYAASLNMGQLPHCELISGSVEGRSGRLAYQGELVRN
ncbi:MAG TPA: polysaccharide deacetylase family protein [Steroidobacteraceae bacterium]|nr:polysaccharide deacetylase family protein [Steroidobacteraceae bacterium]